MTQASHGPDRTDGGPGLYASAVGHAVQEEVVGEEWR